MAGTGLGLSISRSLAMLMGGTIGVASDDGQGSQFWFTAALAPARSGTAAAEDRAALAGQRRAGGRRQRRQPRDHEPPAHGVADCGRDRPTTPTPSCRHCSRRRARGGGFAAAILDHAMPGLDGLGLAARIRAIPDFRRSAPGAGELRRFTPEGAPDVAGAGLSRRCWSKPCSPTALFIRRWRASASSSRASRRRPPRRRRGRRSAPGCGVLIAEDNQVNQVVVKQMLEKLGCRVDAVFERARGGRGGAARALSPRLMDVQMPEMDGLTRDRRDPFAAPPRPPRRVDRRTDRECDGRGRQGAAGMPGMNDFVAKPVRVADLQACLAAGSGSRVGAGGRGGGGVSDPHPSRDFVPIHPLPQAGEGIKPSTLAGEGGTRREAMGG